MKILLMFFISLFNNVHVYDLCSVQENMCIDKYTLLAYPCGIKSMNFGSRDCTQVTFAGTEKMKNNNLGDLTLTVQPNQSSHLALNISFSNIRFKKAYLRISDDNNKNQNVCKMYTIEKETKLPINSDLYDACFWSTAKKLRAKTYFLEYNAENKQEAMYKKIMFDMPNANFYSDTIPVSKRLIFSYIDFSNSYEIVLKIQTLSKSYNVTHYKVEVFREKDKKILLLDVRLLSAYRKTVITFDYLTYNEEGYYYFAISIISDKCSEDACMKTITAKVYISKKGTPLVIGIVGASFIIPFVLFIFHMWNRRFKNSGGIPDAVEKIIILFKSSSEKHNDVVTTLAKTIKQLTAIEVMLDPVNLTKVKQKNADKWCSDNLVLATHILYIPPPEIEDNSCALDYMTYNFLKEETKKSIPEKDIIIVNLPYSTKDIPAILVNCVKFELMDDFQKLIKVFQPRVPDFNYENNINCMELMKKMKLAQTETEELLKLSTPKIVITDQSDNSDEPKEIDVLL